MRFGNLLINFEFCQQDCDQPHLTTKQTNICRTCEKLFILLFFSFLFFSFGAHFHALHLSYGPTHIHAAWELKCQRDSLFPHHHGGIWPWVVTPILQPIFLTADRPGEFRTHQIYHHAKLLKTPPY